MFFFPITKKSRARYALARSLYAACIEQSRKPVFYTELAVPDTFDGRFDLTSLHVGLIVAELARPEGENGKLAQALFDEMFVNLDQTCREMGVGDLSVPKHMKRMMKAFKGRSLSYTEAIQTGGLNDVLARNLYGTVARPDDATLNAMSAYIVALNESLKTQNLMTGAVSFPPVSAHGANTNDTSSQAA